MEDVATPSGVAIHTMKRIPPLNWAGVPSNLRNKKVSAICRTAQECEDLVRWFGDEHFCPSLPVMVLVKNAQPVMIAGMGFASVAELRDCAVVTWHQHEAKGGKILDFDALREKHGLIRREEVDGATREAMTRRIAQHKANLRTDPFREPQYQNPTQKKQYLISKGVGE